MIMFYITSLVLIYLITGSLYLLTALIQFPHPHLLPLVTTNLISFSGGLLVSSFLKCKWFDISVSKMIITLSSYNMSPFWDITSLLSDCFFFYLEDNCFTMLCWFLPFNNVSQPQVYTCPLPLEPPSHPSRLSQSTRLSSLCYTTTSHLLSSLPVRIHRENRLVLDTAGEGEDGRDWESSVISYSHLYDVTSALTPLGAFIMLSFKLLIKVF